MFLDSKTLPASPYGCHRLLNLLQTVEGVVDRERGSDAALASAASGDYPELANAPLRQWSTAGDGVEDFFFLGAERQCERCFQNRDPRRPRGRIAERLAEQPVVGEDLVDRVLLRSLHL
jgi:hypothetical protein